MTLEERLEAGLRVYLARHKPTDLPRGEVYLMLEAMVPELFTNPPGWLAPHEATEEMEAIIHSEDWIEIRDVYLGKDKAAE